jgi:hypothetical protein
MYPEMKNTDNPRVPKHAMSVIIGKHRMGRNSTTHVNVCMPGMVLRYA